MLGFRSNKIDDGVARTRQSVFGRIAGLFRANEITDETWDELEMLLIQADVGVETAEDILTTLRQKVEATGAKSPVQVRDLLKESLVSLLSENQHRYLEGERLLNVVLVVGVNGSGKTTSIAKLARYHKERGDRVLLAAADTFRAAAIDQLRIWADA